MTYEIIPGLHSKDKDHIKMTGGTLTADKTVISTDGPIQLYTYTCELFPKPSDAMYQAFHAGLHTNEHLFAYSQDTGSLRATLHDQLDDLDVKEILDVSPFQLENGSYGFRVTSLVQLDANTLQKAIKASVAKAISFLDTILPPNEGEAGLFAWVPFATAAQCGQFTFHDPKQAQESLQTANTDIEPIEYIFPTEHKKALVCDLRLLKPKTDEADTRITLDPLFSYFLSQTIERELPKIMPGTAVIVGTFGCMTGSYLCVSCEDETKDLPVIHKNIIDILYTISESANLPDNHREQLAQILTNYEEHGIK